MRIHRSQPCTRDASAARDFCKVDFDAELDVGATRSRALAAGSGYIAETMLNPVSVHILSETLLRACCSHSATASEIRTSLGKQHVSSQNEPDTGHLASWKKYGSSTLSARSVEESA